MNNEKFLQTIGELDEKFISEADRDVNAWLGSMYGEVVEVGDVKRSSPWKVLVAASVAAAAVFGVVVLAKNVTNLPKPDVSASSDSTLAEQLASYKIQNLNFDKAVVFDNTPSSEQWQRRKYEMLRFGEQSADRLIAVAANYGVTIDKNDLMVAKRDVGFGFGEIPLSEADFEKYSYAGIYYNSDDFYIHAIPSPVNWIELVNKKNAQTISGAEMNGFGAWRPSDNRVREETVNPSDENRTCVLDGKTVKVADALRNAQKMISESDVFPKEFNVEKISSVWLYTYENGNQGLWIELTYTLDRVPYVSPSSLHLDIGKASNQAYSAHLYIGMLTENSIDWIWQYKSYAETEYTSENCSVDISEEDALKLVSMNLDQNDTFIVREIQLVYADRLTEGGNTLCIEPTWLVWLSNDEKWDTERLYAYVSAVDGNVEILEKEF